MVEEENLSLFPLGSLVGPHVPEEECLLGPEGPVAEELRPGQSHQHAQTYDIVGLFGNGGHQT